MKEEKTKRINRKLDEGIAGSLLETRREENEELKLLIEQ
jgi:hypothetical protein